MLEIQIDSFKIKLIEPIMFTLITKALIIFVKMKKGGKDSG